MRGSKLVKADKGGGYTSIGYIFLPYQAFNIEGVNKLGRKPLLPRIEPPTQAPQRGRNSLPTRHRQSKLIQSTTPSDISDAESITLKKSAASHNSIPIANSDLPFQIRAKIASCKKLLAKQKNIVNSKYY